MTCYASAGSVVHDIHLPLSALAFTCYSLVLISLSDLLGQTIHKQRQHTPYFINTALSTQRVNIPSENDKVNSHLP